MTRATSAFPVFALVLLLAACGGGDGPTDPGNGGGNNDGGSGGGPTGPVVKTDPSFSSDIMEVFTRRGCTESSCHGSGQGGLTMTSTAGTYQNLVNVASAGASGEVRVIPGNANDSYLVKKLEGRQSVGARMPSGGSPLDATDLTNIKNWINQGAKNN